MIFLEKNSVGQDYRLHLNETIQIDLKQEIDSILNLIACSVKSSDYVSLNVEPGWYNHRKKDQTSPVIPAVNNYTSLEGNEFAKFTMITKNTRAIYDEAGQLILEGPALRSVRPYPREYNSINSMIIEFFTELFNYHCEYAHHDCQLSTVDAIITPWILKKPFTLDDLYKDNSFTLPAEVYGEIEETSCLIFDMLDEYSRLITSIACANSLNVISVTMSNGIMTIKNLGDYRIREYERMKLEESINKQIEEQNENK